jgi:hypothetical protein
MSTTRKQTNANTQQPPNYIPPYYPYPGYGYISPQLYNPAYVDPYTYPTLPYDEPEYVYYPTDDYGNAVGPPSRFPPINSRYSEGYYPYPDYTPNVPSYVPYIPSPRIDPMAYNGYYNYYQDPYIHRGNERPRREASPPKRKNVSIFILFRSKIQISFIYSHLLRLVLLHPQIMDFNNLWSMTKPMIVIQYHRDMVDEIFNNLTDDEKLIINN